MKTYNLKYGCNPHQKPASIYVGSGEGACANQDTGCACSPSELPFKLLNGNPGYINLMDALNAWQLVKELKQSTKLPAAASFKHVSPAGAAVGLPLSDALKSSYFVEGMDLSPLACAYARARGADRVSSFGDFVALSDIVDKATALLLKMEVSDGVIAPGYTIEALEILKAKKKGNYNIIEMDPNYEPEDTECRSIYGIQFEQLRNKEAINYNYLNNIVTENKSISDDAKRDMLISMITLKYTQSNSVCYVYNGQVIGNGAGQQSRIHCTRLAGDKADIWFLRQHPQVQGLQFRAGLSRSERDNAIDLYLRDDITENERRHWEGLFEEIPKVLLKSEKRAWLSTLQGVTLGSDAFFPFRDNIDRAYQSGVRYIVQPGGSFRDDVVLAACNEYDIAMVYTGIRLFHH